SPSSATSATASRSCTRASSSSWPTPTASTRTRPTPTPQRSSRPCRQREFTLGGRGTPRPRQPSPREDLVDASGRGGRALGAIESRCYHGRLVGAHRFHERLGQDPRGDRT